MPAFRASQHLRARLTPPLLSSAKPPHPDTNGPRRPGPVRTNKAATTSKPPPSSSPPPNFDQGNERSLWESYKSLKPRTRQIMGAAVFLFALAGQYGSSWLEEKMPAKETGTGSTASKTFNVRVVDRQQPPTPIPSS